MSLANTKGGFNVTLRVTQNSSNESLCILQKPLLKKAENWSLQVTDLFINKTASLNRELGEQFRIVPFSGTYRTGYRLDDYVFTPHNCFTIMEYVIQLQRFFNKFSFLFWQYGATNPLGLEGLTFIADEDVVHTPINYTKTNYRFDDEGQAEQEGYKDLDVICSCSLDSDLKLKIWLDEIFTANFFIECTDHFATRLGFAKFIFRVDDIIPPNNLFVHGPFPEVGYPPFIADVATRGVPASDTTWLSGFTVRELDDRLSIDLVSTFPASRKIHILDGKEEHEFLLARFDLSNLKSFESVTFQDDDVMYTSTKIRESYEAGIENLTRGNADYDSNLLLPGSIQQIHLMLYTRYLEHGEIKRDKTDMKDGFWHCRILFSKKV